MLYLQTRTILVEITKVNASKPFYLIGDEKLNFVPQTVWKASFKNANWNRALKYEVDQMLKTINPEIKRTSRYYALSFDLYLAFNPSRVVYLAFNQFDNQILNQTAFASRILPQVIANYQKNYQGLVRLNATWLASRYLEVVPQPLTDINGFLVNAEFDVNDPKYRWNYLIKLGRENKISFSDHHQLIYELDAKRFVDPWSESFWLIDLVHQQIYYQGYLEVQNNHHLKLAVNCEEPLITSIRKRIILMFISLLPSNQTKFFHQYNLTGNGQYLVEFMEATKDLPYFTWKRLSAEIFTTLNLNYNDLLYSLKETKPFLFAKVTSLKELNDLISNLNRFGNLTLNEQEKIKELRARYNVSK